MRSIWYSVAMSLDGFIAGPNGEHDWITMDPDIDFASMMAKFDTMLMGRRTYEVAMRGGGGGGRGTEVWVFSRTLRPEEHAKVHVVADRIGEQLDELRSRAGTDIWLFGGGTLFRSLLALGHVDTVEVAIIPVLLGGGMPLLPSPADRSLLELRQHRAYPKTGTVTLEYGVKRGRAPAKGRRSRS